MLRMTKKTIDESSLDVVKNDTKTNPTQQPKKKKGGMRAQASRGVLRAEKKKTRPTKGEKTTKHLEV